MGIRENQRPLLVAGAFMVLIALACNAPADGTLATITAPAPTSTTPQTRVIRPTPSPSPAFSTPTNTPVPNVSGPSGCTLNAVYVTDVTVPDDTQFDPGAAFTKVWRVRNSGTCTWEEGTLLIFVSGDPLGGPATVDVAQEVPPDSNVDISVPFVAPSTPGTYRSTWQLQAPDGLRFGTQIYVQIVVPEPVTETPAPTQEPTEQPDAPDLVISHLAVDTDDPRQGIPLHIVATLHNQGDQVAEDFHWAWRVCVTDDCEYIQAPGSFSLEPDEEIIAQMEYTFTEWATYTTEARVDSDDNVEESDETNNMRQLVITVKPGLPDLVISAITFDPDPPVQGQGAIVEIGVHNQGSKPTDAFKVEWWDGVNSAQPGCEWTVADGLAAGETAKMACTFVYSSEHGSITTRAIADADDAVGELDETNNALDRDISVEQP
jgi:hypothetical protein